MARSYFQEAWKKKIIARSLHFGGISHLGLIKIVMETNDVIRLLPDREADIVHMNLSMDAG